MDHDPPAFPAGLTRHRGADITLKPRTSSTGSFIIDHTWVDYYCRSAAGPFIKRVAEEKAVSPENRGKCYS